MYLQNYAPIYGMMCTVVAFFLIQPLYFREANNNIFFLLNCLHILALIYPELLAVTLNSL